MPLIVLCNPACGVGDGVSFVRKHVLPLLHDAGKIVDDFLITERPGHAGELMVEHLRSTPEEQTHLILSSGDGTLHEIVNAVCESSTGRVHSLLIALVPSGTANALFSSLFPSATSSATSVDHATDCVIRRTAAVQSLLREDATTPLSLTKTVISDEDPLLGSKETISVVVTSTALHMAFKVHKYYFNIAHP